MLLLFIVAACAPAPQLQGTNLEKDPAPDFALSDAAGRPFRLSEQKGRAVVLTFLYANCPDECPLIAERLRAANDQLGGDAANVRWVAVSLDPVGDTAPVVAQFLKAHRVESQLTYLIGAREQLAPVWKSYFIAVTPGVSLGALSHQSRVIVIDRDGLQRSNFRADLDTAALVNDIRIALK
ncbi:MAG: SCO family protein [Chloroflexi bacterium]|nr:SCO family protein [Chloroflexota bacterium]